MMLKDVMHFVMKNLLMYWKKKLQLTARGIKGEVKGEENTGG